MSLKIGHRKNEKHSSNKLKHKKHFSSNRVFKFFFSFFFFWIRFDSTEKKKENEEEEEAQEQECTNSTYNILTFDWFVCPYFHQPMRIEMFKKFFKKNYFILPKMKAKIKCLKTEYMDSMISSTIEMCKTILFEAISICCMP